MEGARSFRDGWLQNEKGGGEESWMWNQENREKNGMDIKWIIKVSHIITRVWLR